MNILESNIKRIRSLMILEDELDTDINLAKTGSDQDIKQKGPSTNDGDNNNEDGMDENELSEEEGAETTATSTDTASKGYPSMEKWGTGAQRGPGNPLTGKMQIRRTLGPTGKNYK